MLRQEVSQIIDTLKTFARLLEKDGLYTEVHRAEFERVTAMLSAMGLDDAPIDLLPISKAAGFFLDRVLESVKSAEMYKNEPLKQAQICIDMSEVYYLLGDWDASLSRIQEALAFLMIKRDEAMMADVYMRIGRVHSRRAKWDEADESLLRALSFYQILEDREGEARTLLLLANADFLRGKYAEAREKLEQALLAGELPEDLKGDIHLTWGVVEQVGGEYDLATEHFEHSLSHFEFSDDHRRLSQVYFNQGILLAEQEKWADAGSYYETSLIYARDVGDLSMIGILYLRRGEMAVKLNDPKLALRYGRRAKDIFTQLEMTSGVADVYRLFGEVAGMAGAREDAHKFFAESRRMQQIAESPLGEVEVVSAEGALYENEADATNAEALYQHALSTVSQIGADGVHAQRLQDALNRLQDQLNENP